MNEPHVILVYAYMNCTGDDAVIHTHKPDRGATHNVCVCTSGCMHEPHVILVYAYMHCTGDDAVIHTHKPDCGATPSTGRRRLIGCLKLQVTFRKSHRSQGSYAGNYLQR